MISDSLVSGSDPFESSDSASNQLDQNSSDPRESPKRMGKSGIRPEPQIRVPDMLPRRI